MLRQEINLYRILDREKPLVLPTWSHFWLTQSLCFIVFAMMTLFSIWHLYQLEQETAHLTQIKAQQEKQFLAIKSTIPAAYFLDTSSNKWGTLTSTTSKQESIVSALTSTVSFTGLLSLIGHFITPDVWLTDISFTEEGRNINLQGHSMTVTSLQYFINALNTNPDVKHYKITVNTIGSVNSKTSNDILDFDLTLTKQREG